MDRRAYLLNMRKAGLLKGQKPCFITLRQNLGKIYNSGSADFIMSYRNGVLYFQILSLFLRNLKPKLDFEVHTGRFTEYKFVNKNFMNTLYLYDADGNYLEIHYQKGNIETASTEDNIQRIIDILKENGLKLAEDED